MSKELEALNFIANKMCGYCPYNNEDMLGEVCVKCEKHLDIIEKGLKALEIIKEKRKTWRIKTRY